MEKDFLLKTVEYTSRGVTEQLTVEELAKRFRVDPQILSEYLEDSENVQLALSRAMFERWADVIFVQMRKLLGTDYVLSHSLEELSKSYEGYLERQVSVRKQLNDFLNICRDDELLQMETSDINLLMLTHYGRMYCEFYSQEEVTLLEALKKITFRGEFEIMDTDHAALRSFFTEARMSDVLASISDGLKLNKTEAQKLLALTKEKQVQRQKNCAVFDRLHKTLG